MSYVKSEELTHLIFITDDNKEDWWLKINENGSKTISPRPELVSEIMQNECVKRFHMYSSDGFLKYASKYLDLDVSKDTIQEIHDVSLSKEKDDENLKRSDIARKIAEMGVFYWLNGVFIDGRIDIHLTEVIPIVVYEGHKCRGFVVKRADNIAQLMSVLSGIDVYLRFNDFFNEIDEFNLVIVCSGSVAAENIFNSISVSDIGFKFQNVFIGYLDFNNDSIVKGSFVPVAQLDGDGQSLLQGI